MLVQEGYRGHNIVQYLGRFWGLPVTLGQMNLANEADRQRPGVLVAESLAELTAAISRGGGLHGSRGMQAVKNAVKSVVRSIRPRAGDNATASERWVKTSPQTTLGETYRGYKIIRFEFKFFGVPRTIRKFRYADFLAGKYGDTVPVAYALSELKNLPSTGNRNPAKTNPLFFCRFQPHRPAATTRTTRSRWSQRAAESKLAPQTLLR